jgi:putative acetyltransferase
MNADRYQHKTVNDYCNFGITNRAVENKSLIFFKFLSMYRIDMATPTVYPTLLHIWESSVRATHHFLSPADIDFFKQVIQEKKLFAHVNLTVVRDTANNILGFTGVAGDRLEMMFLAPSERGKGIGRMLLLHAIEILKITKVDVNEQNEDALRFYEHFGFKVISRSETDGTGKPYPLLHMELA